MGPDYLDFEVKTLTEMVGRGQWQPHELSRIEAAIRDRKSQVYAGTMGLTQRRWTRRLQGEVDPLLRVRWEFEQNAGWVIDRWVEQWGCWAIVGVLGRSRIRSDLVEYLRERDMQRLGAQEYLRRKRASAEQIKNANEKAATEKLLAAVDSLTEKRVRNFIEVERAIQTGENIVARGETKKSLERMEQASKHSPAPPQGSFNPGMRPDRLKRKQGGKHIKE